MSDQSSSGQTSGQAPAGWYPVETGSTRLRYWDGTSWTEHFHDTTASVVAAVGPVPTVAPEGTSGNTIWGWLLLIFPVGTLLTLIPARAYLQSLAHLDFTDPNSILRHEFTPLYGVLAVSGFLTSALFVLFAGLDWRALKLRGVPRPFHWGFAFLALVTLGVFVYPIGRGVVLRRRTGHGLLPMWIFIAVMVIALIVSTVSAISFTVEFLDSFRSQISTYNS